MSSVRSVSHRLWSSTDEADGGRSREDGERASKFSQAGGIGSSVWVIQVMFQGNERRGLWFTYHEQWTFERVDLFRIMTPTVHVSKHHSMLRKTIVLLFISLKNWCWCWFGTSIVAHLPPVWHWHAKTEHQFESWLLSFWSASASGKTAQVLWWLSHPRGRSGWSS